MHYIHSVKTKWSNYLPNTIYINDKKGSRAKSFRSNAKVNYLSFMFYMQYEICITT